MITILLLGTLIVLFAWVEIKHRTERRHLRRIVQDYVATEGCDCCEGTHHKAIGRALLSLVELPDPHEWPSTPGRGCGATPIDKMESVYPSH